MKKIVFVFNFTNVYVPMGQTGISHDATVEKPLSKPMMIQVTRKYWITVKLWLITQLIENQIQ